MERRLAVTGASGALGRFVVHESLRRGYKVIALSRHRPSDPVCAQHWREFDLLKPGNQWNELLSKCDSVIHLAAAKSATKNLKSSILWKTNVEGTLRLIEALGVAQVPHLILCSAANVPEKEWRGPYVSRALYLSSKLAQEWVASAACAELGIENAIMRISSVVGDGRSALDCIAKAILSGGPVEIANGDSFGADFVSARDVASGLMLAFEHRLTGVYNLSSGSRTSLGQAARQMAQLAGESPNIIKVIERSDNHDDGFPPADCSPLKQFGYCPTNISVVLSEMVKSSG